MAKVEVGGHIHLQEQKLILTTQLMCRKVGDMSPCPPEILPCLAYIRTGQPHYELLEFMLGTLVGSRGAKPPEALMFAAFQKPVQGLNCGQFYHCNK